MAYVEGIIHDQGLSRLFAPAMFEPQDAVHCTLGLSADNVRRQGRAIVERGSAIFDPALASQDFAAGDRFTIANAGVENFAAGEPSAPLRQDARAASGSTGPQGVGRGLSLARSAPPYKASERAFISRHRRRVRQVSLAERLLSKSRGTPTRERSAAGVLDRASTGRSPVLPRHPNAPSYRQREQAEQTQFNSEDKGYKSALLSTLKRTRELLAAGRL